MLLTLLFLTLQRSAQADCIGGDTADPDCDTTCDALQAEKKALCESFHVDQSDTYWQWFPAGCTPSLDGCPQVAMGQCRSYTVGNGPIIIQE